MVPSKMDLTPGDALLALILDTFTGRTPLYRLEESLRACLIIRESKRNLMKMRTSFHKFCVNSRTIDIKFGGIGAILMGLQPIHQLSNRLLGPKKQ